MAAQKLLGAEPVWPKHNGEMQSLSKRGKAVMDSHSARKCTNPKFSLGCVVCQSRLLQLHPPFLGHTLRIFAEGDAVRIHGIGRGWQELWALHRRLAPNSEGATQFRLDFGPQL